MAVREEEADQPPANVDNASPDVAWPRREVPAPASISDEPDADATYVEAPGEAPQEAYDDEPYGAPEDAYPYPHHEPYHAGGDGRRRGPSVLPIVGFILLCALALGVGAVLASVLAGPGEVGQASPTPSAEASVPASVEPTLEPTAAPSDEASATPGATESPVIFPDGAQLSIQPCGSSTFEDDAVGRPEADACPEDSSSIEEGEVWAFIVFADTPGSDSLTVQLLENDQVVNEQEMTIDEVLGNCGSSCNGLIYGAHYVGLFPGDYQLRLQREGELADSAMFTVED